MVLGGWELTVHDAAIQTGPDGRERLVVSVTVANVGSEPRLYQAFFWELRMPDGGRRLVSPIDRPESVPFEELAPGEGVSAEVVFATGTGRFALLFDDVHTARAGRPVWPVEA